MLLCARGNEKYFNPRVLNLLKDNENAETLKMLRSGCRIQHSLELHQAKDSWQATLLHYAAAYGSEDIIQQLIEFGSEVDAQDKFGRTPLMLAASRDHEVAVQVLLRAGADVHLLDCEGRSALQMILDRKPMCLGIIIALFKQLTLGQIARNITVEELADKLHEAGYTLQNALLMENADLMRVFLSRGNVMDARDSFTGGTPLHLAVRMRKVEMLKLLVEHGADVHVTDYYGSTPLDYLYGAEIEPSRESAEILKVILSRLPWVPWMDVTKVLSFGDERAIGVLYEVNVDFFATDFCGNTVLHFLAKNDNAEAVKLLKNLHLYVNERNKDGCTPLDFAAMENSLRVVRLLLDNGAKVDGEGEHRGTLHLAFRKKHMPDRQCVELLLRHGADPQERDLEDHSAIFDSTIALAREDPMLVPELLCEDVFTRVQPVLAHLAVVQALGTEITSFTRGKIQMRASWLEYFYMCEWQVDRLSKTTIYGDVTLLSFLTDREQKVLAYVRNAELVSELVRLTGEFEANSPYADLIRRRLDDAIRSAELRDKAITAIGRIVGSKNNSHYFVAGRIVGYVSVQDMENLIAALL